MTFSSYRQLASASKTLVSLPTFERLLLEISNASTVAAEIDGTAMRGRAGERSSADVAVKMSKLFVRLRDDVTRREREEVISSLRNYIRDDLTQVVDTDELVVSTGTAIAALQYFFIVVTVIAIVLCFFVLWLSFTANIRENAWEFGVLRSLGLSAAQVMRIYVYESSALIFSALLLGTAVGVLQALTLTLQFALFTELPITLDLPYELFAVVVALSCAVAWAGSYWPTRKIARKRIASVLKGL